MSSLTELEDLRLFLQERVQAYDPSVDTELGSSFDNNVIQPLMARLGPDPYDTPIRDFIIGRLKVEFPDLVIQDGEPIDDYAVKIMQVLLTPFRRQIRQISNNQSLADPGILNESEADNLASNFFAQRSQGGFAVGVARLYYSSPQYALITPSNPVSTEGGWTSTRWRTRPSLPTTCCSTRKTTSSISTSWFGQLRRVRPTT